MGWIGESVQRVLTGITHVQLNAGAASVRACVAW